MKEISITKNQIVLVDDDDYAWLSQWKWQYDGGYASRTCWSKKKKKYQKMFMHRAVLLRKLGMDTDMKVMVDHKNRNRLDNQSANLRIANSSQNCANRVKSIVRQSFSQYKGVSYRTNRSKPWVAQISVYGQPRTLGYYLSEIEAASAYDSAAIVQYGEFACLNFPLDIVV